jgi:hypothetical protein
MATVNYPARVHFGQAKTGLAASVFCTVTDSAGTIQIARSASGVAEETDSAGSAVTGCYSKTLALDPTWFPAVIKWDLVGYAGVIVEETVGLDYASSVAVGVTAPAVR